MKACCGKCKASSPGAITTTPPPQANSDCCCGEKCDSSGNRGTLSPRALFVRVDITQEDPVKEAIQKAVQTFGPNIHGLINCAGVGFSKLVVNKKQNGEPFPLQTFKTVINVNLIGSFNVMRLVAQQMAHQEVISCPHNSQKQNTDGERGIIINTSSVAAEDGQIGQAAYSASKGGVASMTLPVARELSRYGVRCVCVAPGLFLTPMLKMLPEKARESLAKQVPFPRRLGNPQEFADLCTTIIENPMLNGTCIRLDGSIRMSSM